MSGYARVGASAADPFRIDSGGNLDDSDDSDELEESEGATSSDSSADGHSDGGSATLKDIVNGATFQGITAGVILTCTISMAVETDTCNDGECYFWWYWNSVILVYFTVEVLLRIAANGCSFFYCCGNSERKDCIWNYFDLSIVLICILTDWLEPILSAVAGNNGVDKRSLEILRIFRIFRILRTIRIFKSFEQLNKLAEGLLISIGTVFWIALLMLMVMVIFAIVLTDAAGNQAKAAELPAELFFENKEEIEVYWGTVGKSLITLFQILTLDNWVYVTDIVVNEMPMMWFIFFLYIFTMGFAMLSLLTGVVAEHMTEVSLDAKNEKERETDERFRSFLQKRLPCIAQEAANSPLAKKFGARDGEQTLNRAAFRHFLQDKEVQDALAEYSASIDVDHCDEFWDCLDRDGNGALTVAELRNGFMRLRSPIQPKDMLRLRYAAERVARTLEGGQGRASTARKLEEIKADLSEVEVKLAQIHAQIRGFMDFTRSSRSMQSLCQGVNRLRRSAVCT